MGEPAKPRRPAVRSSDEDDPLAAINDHLGRFLRQADQLLDDWARFGADVRTRVTHEVDRVGAAVEQAVDGSVGLVADRAAARVSDDVAGRLAARLADVHDEIDRATRAARRATAAVDALHTGGRRTSRWAAAALAAAVVADALLLALLVRQPDTAPVAPVPGVAAACSELSVAWSDAAFTIVRAAGVDACGDLAATVDAVILAKLRPPEPPAPEPVATPDAGVADAAPAPARGR